MFSAEMSDNSASMRTTSLRLQRPAAKVGLKTERISWQCLALQQNGKYAQYRRCGKREDGRHDVTQCTMGDGAEALGNQLQRGQMCGGSVIKNLE